MIRSASAILATLGLATVLTACISGQDDLTSSGPADPGVEFTEAGVVEVLDVLAPALVDGDGPRVCALMAADAQRRYETATGQPTCIDAVSSTQSELTARDRSGLAAEGSWAVSISGDRATARGDRAEGLTRALFGEAASEVALARIEGRWALQ